MARKQVKDKNSKPNREIRQRRALQVIFAVFSIILILSMILSMLITN
jgi:hypothetical protein